MNRWLWNRLDAATRVRAEDNQIRGLGEDPATVRQQLPDQKPEHVQQAIRCLACGIPVDQVRQVMDAAESAARGIDASPDEVLDVLLTMSASGLGPRYGA